MAKKNNFQFSNLIDCYRQYHFNQLNTNRFSHGSLIHAIDSFANYKELKIATIGVSEEGREIKSVKYGSGSTRVLLWSQMHGNESTATRAILDILNFLVVRDEFNEFREQIANDLTLLFVPMVNPDGAERFQRRTSTEIDMNRDAIAMQSPEGKILNGLVDEFKPAFAFNLHDQRRFYNVKGTEVPSSMSFLAPAYNLECEVNTSRQRAMQMVVGMNKTLQLFIPGGIGLYDDAFSPRSFGDHLQGKGISTVLIESGWLKDDMEKEEVRKLTFIAIVKALELMTSNKLEEVNSDEYNLIPAIDTRLFDVLLKKVENESTSSAKVDIGINRTEHLINHPVYYSEGKMDDLGDLSLFYGFQTIDASKLRLIAGKSVKLNSYDELSMVSVKRWLRKGVLFLVSSELPIENYLPYPINIIHPRKLHHMQHLQFEGYANFLLVNKNNKIEYIIMNGFVMKPDQIDTSTNGLVIC